MSTRFRSVLCAAAGLVFAAALQVNTTGAAPSGQPNILVIMSDEHNASVLGCYGNNILSSIVTKNPFDRLPPFPLPG